MSLRWRIALALASVAGAVGLLAAATAYIATRQELSASINRDLTERGNALSELGHGGTTTGRGNRPAPQGGLQRGPDGDQANGCPSVGRLQGVAASQRVLPDGTKIPCLGSTDDLEFEPSDAGTGPVLRTVGEGATAYRLMTTPWHEGGYVQLARSLSESHDVLERVLALLVAITLTGIALAAAAGWFLASRATRPIIRLRDTAERIASTQDLSTPVPTEATGEVGSLARSFTSMMTALAGSREQQKRLVSDASHEMRTPLTSLRTNVELLEHFDRLPLDDRKAVLSAVQIDAVELTHLVSELVELATDQTTNDEQPEPLRLADLAAEVVERAARRSGRDITITGAGAGTGTGLVDGRPAMLQRAISNLVENAVKYSPAGTPIEVAIDGGRLEVRDHGTGIDPTDQPLVFERFYRATATRTEPGSGLGLAIVKQIIDRHAGSVWARNHPDGGALVGFSLPT